MHGEELEDLTHLPRGEIQVGSEVCPRECHRAAHEASPAAAPPGLSLCQFSSLLLSRAHHIHHGGVHAPPQQSCSQFSSQGARMGSVNRGMLLGRRMFPFKANPAVAGHGCPRSSSSSQRGEIPRSSAGLIAFPSEKPANVTREEDPQQDRERNPHRAGSDSSCSCQINIQTCLPGVKHLKHPPALP